MPMETYQSFPNPPSEDVILGMPEGRNLSPVRRFFVLIATFDFLFTVLLWTLCVILVKGGDNIIESFEAEIIQFSFRISIFDLVMCSASRFVILLLFYGLLQFHHWLPVAFTTAASCAFLLSKVFLFGWKEYGSSSPWPVFLVLSGFVIAWAEAWFLDFRVVPLERQAQFYVSRQSAAISQSQGVIPWLSQSVSQIVLNQAGSQISYPESVSNFFSPLQSPLHSDGEETSETESVGKRRRLRQMNESPEAQLWLQQGPIISVELLDKASSPLWVRIKNSTAGDIVYSQKLNHKIYKITGTIPSTPDKIIDELFRNFESMPEWSPSVTFCQVLQTLNTSTDVTYQVSKQAAGGRIQPRDFVTLRHITSLPDGRQILAWVSVKHSAKPKQDKITRGTHGIAGWVLTPSLEINTTEFEWVMDMDLQLPGWTPKLLVENALIAASLETLACLRNKVTFLPDQQVEVAVDVNDGDLHV
jgi:hypothetical protein